MERVQIQNLVASVLTCAQNPAHWANVLDDVNAALGVASSCMYATHAFEKTRRVIHWSETNRQLLTPENRLRMENGDDADDEPAYQFLYRSAPMRFYNELEMFGVKDASDLPPSEIRDITQSMGYRMRFAAVLNRNGPWLDGFFCQTVSVKQDRELRTNANSNLFLPLMAGTVELGRIFAALKAKHGAALKALNALGLAVFLLDGSGYLIDKNAEAANLLDDRDGISIDRAGKLKARTSSDTANLQAATEIACAPFSSRKSPRPLLLPRCSARPEYLATVVPLFDAEAELQPGLRCAFMTVIDPTRKDRISVDGLRVLGNLTPGEGDVAQLAVAGMDIAAIAEHRGTSINTVKTQLRAVYQKLRCSGQNELMRLAAATRLPIL